MGQHKKIFFYADDWPHATGSGAHLRFRSNVQAWVDLGYAVEVIRVAMKHSEPPAWQGVTFTSLIASPRPATAWGRLQYRLGHPGQAAIAQHYVNHAVTRAAVAERMRSHPNAWHMLEGDSIANAALWFPRNRLLFSHHDLSGDALQATYESVAQAENRPLSPPERREIAFIRSTELAICRHSRHVFCISNYDCDVLRTRHGIAHASYLPMSISPETCIARPGTHGQEELRLLHTGKVSHLPSFRSLEFLFREVFPRMRPDLRARLRLRIAGASNGTDARTLSVRAMAEPYGDIIEWAGFLPDLDPSYEWADLQVVTSTEASGLRTRIVESLAKGLPVLSTPAAARGCAGLVHGQNILLAESPDACATLLERLVTTPASLIAIAEQGRELYREQHSQQTVARRLGELMAAL